ncbi:hypothetical protein [Phenylobacterium sp.]|uniref:hypothetical protein n=1 Tax=Phenylobacterium sp. TaxID=1871053 RepID=UPI002EDAC9BB
MRTLIQNADLRRLFTGASLAVVAGLAIGAAIQPPLQDRILAPQQQMAGGGTRNYATPSEAGIGLYPGQVPEYVIGTNYTRPPPMTAYEGAYEEGAEPTAHDATDYAQTAEATAPARWVVEPHPAPLYPSERGNAWNPSDLPEAPEPPVDTASPAA